ncbi:MAG: SulP family inorganic anion transporter [Chitinophagaceae bacterium]|nr:SulP family inorganic anion transporter [Chitinophagaceae bacterium]
MKKIFQNAAADLPASVVVFLVALPLCLGIALGSNAPNLFAGIIGGIVGGIVIGSLSGSQLSVSGPAAGLTAIVAVAIGKLPAYEAFLLSVVIAGMLQLLFGFLKAGFLGDYVPNSVIKGMLAAIGLILILKQLPHLVGFDKDFSGDETFFQKDSNNTFSEIFYAFNYITPVAVLIGVLGILIQVLWEKVLVKKAAIFKLIPAPLVIVTMGILLNISFGKNDTFALEQEHLVNIPVASSFTQFTSFFTSPDWGFIINTDVWITALTLALVASLETLLSIEASDKLDPYKRVTNNNRELKAQGIGNIVSGLIGGLPLTSVIVRSSANVNAGAKTKLSAISHGVLLLLCVAFIPVLLNKIPYAALASILIYTGYKLAKVSLFKEFYAKGWDQFIPFITTLLAILLTDLLKGIIVGIVVGLYFVMRSNYKSAVFVVHDNNKFLFRFRKDVSFLNKATVKRKLEEVPGNAYVLIDTTRADFIDKDVIDTINEFTLHAPIKNIKVEIKKSYYKPMHELLNSNTKNEKHLQDDIAH